jgi:hypothetical protein
MVVSLVFIEFFDEKSHFIDRHEFPDEISLEKVFRPFDTIDFGRDYNAIGLIFIGFIVDGEILIRLIVPVDLIRPFGLLL